jgi:hypothetical protein
MSDARSEGTGMPAGRSWQPALAWTLVVAVLATTTLSLVRLHRPGVPTSQVMESGMWSAILLAFAFVGAFIVQHRPDQRVGWLLIVPGLSELTSAASASLTVEPEKVTAGLLLALWGDNLSWLLVIFPIILLVALFPTGHPVADRWRWHTRAVLGMATVLALLVVLSRDLGPLDADWRIANPVGFLPSLDDMAWFLPTWATGLVMVTVTAAIAMVVRFRAAGSVERQQLKWLLYAFSVFVVSYSLAVVVNERVHAFISQGLLVLGVVVIPFAIMIAVFRHRLFDIDLVIRRTAVYAILTSLLVALYVGAVLSFQALLGAIVVHQDSSVTVAASTLFVAVLFRPLKRSTQDLVARRLFRAHRDAARLLADFGQAIRLRTDTTQLTEDLAAIVKVTLLPSTVGVWLPTLPPPGDSGRNDLSRPRPSEP